MDLAHRRLIEAIHAAPYKCVLALTGGGAQAAALLLNVPGGSRTILETVVPYSDRALTDWLGRRPASFCSSETSHAMALRAYARARWLAPGEQVLGLGCTASLATDRPKKGEHRFHVSTHVARGTLGHSLILTKGARDREAEEGVVDAVILNALAVACNVGERLDIPVLSGESVQLWQSPSQSDWDRFMAGDLPTTCVEADGRIRAGPPRPAVLLPGSFNPVHAGHWQLAAAAARLAGGEVAFELSITNVDKPTLNAEEVRRRTAQFQWRAPLWLSRAPLFAEKAVLFPGVVFVIGADTALRLIQPRYYHDSPAQVAAALESIRARGCRFLVAGRCDAGGRFQGLDQLGVPEKFRDLFAPIPEADFRLDLSSTRLRQCADAAVAAETVDG